MTAEALIELVRENLGDDSIDNVKDAITALWGHGSCDAGSGDMQAPSGHFIRQDRWIVLTNVQGVETLEEYDTVEDAERAYAAYEDAYADWADEGEED